MDDVVLMHTEKTQMQNMLDTTHEIASRYRIRFGSQKIKTLCIGKEPAQFNIGTTKLEQTETYTYLGITMSNKGTLKHHINQTRGKCEASMQAITSIAKHRHIREKEMFTIMKLHEACTIPMLLYGIEGLIPTKMERKELGDINTNIMRRIINTPPPPPTTSKELIMMETDQVPVDTKIDERQIIYHMKKLNANKTQSLRETIDNDPRNKNLKIAMEKYNITEENLGGKSNNQMKQIMEIKSKQPYKGNYHSKQSKQE